MTDVKMRGRIRAWLLRWCPRRAGGTGRVVGEFVAVIPVLADQVRQAATQIDTAVNDVTASFNGLVVRARRAVVVAQELAAASESNETGASAEDRRFNSLVTASRRALERLLAHSIKGSQLSMEAVYRVEDIVRTMQTIARTTKEVDSIAMGIRLVALNAKIEAVHVGERGVGFGVVAGEIAGQAMRATSVAESIRTEVASLEHSAGLALESLQAIASIREKETTEELIAMLESRDGQLREELAATAALSERLADDVSRAVVALQFHDRVNQRLSHVVQTLGDMHEAFARVGSRVPAADQGKASVTRMRARYTMAEERQAELAPTGTAGAAAGGIEIF